MSLRVSKHVKGDDMKGKRFSEEQIVKVLKRIEVGERPKDVCREIGVHEQTIYNWKSKYSGMEVSDVKEMKRLQEENTRLKRLVADLTLDNVMLKDINSKKW
jgi:putative transposase